MFTCLLESSRWNQHKDKRKHFLGSSALIHRVYKDKILKNKKDEKAGQGERTSVFDWFRSWNSVAGRQRCTKEEEEDFPEDICLRAEGMKRGVDGKIHHTVNKRKKAVETSGWKGRNSVNSRWITVWTN